MNVDELQETSWPGYCCVPAFVLRAATYIAGEESKYHALAARTLAAETLQVCVPPWDPNPWRLPTRNDPSEWGVTPTRALELYPDLTKRLDMHVGRLEVKSLNTIDFERYEPEILERQANGAVVGLGFRYISLKGDHPRLAAAQEDSGPYHLTRLTPIVDDDTTRTIKSPEFDWGYQGPIRIFDDSGEIKPADYMLDWSRLLSACIRSEGAIWAIYPPECA